MEYVIEYVSVGLRAYPSKNRIRTRYVSSSLALKHGLYSSTSFLPVPLFVISTSVEWGSGDARITYNHCIVS